ncbi:MAG: hypothetical protein R2794_02650, partial [Chitinophagales bacterium]
MQAEILAGQSVKGTLFLKGYFDNFSENNINFIPLPIYFSNENIYAMRKLILTLATGFLSVSLFAQAAFQVTPHNRAEMLAKFKNAKAVPFHPNFTDESGVPVDNATFQAKAGSRTGEMIGSTGYDLQSNAATMYRVVGYPDGSVSALWTGSTVADGAWSDRGMFYNHSDGATWGAAPTSRVEGVRSGFGGIMSVMDHEVEYSHDGTNIR